MKNSISKEKFGPWALVTGASSGIGEEFANQLAAQGFNIVLVARREQQLSSIASELEEKYHIETKVASIDLSEDGFISKVALVTDTLDIGLVISNAGIAFPGELIRMDINDLKKGVRINVLAHLELARYFGGKLASRGKGGIIFLSAMGSVNGVPFLSNAAATKAYVYSLALGLHTELKRYGVNVTVLSPGVVDTPGMADLGLTAADVPMKPMSAKQCVTEALVGLKQNKAEVIPGMMNRLINALAPASVGRNMMAKMLTKSMGITR